MSAVNAFGREIKFIARDRSVWLWMGIVFGLSVISVGFGITEVKRQHATIEQLVDADKQERSAAFEKQKDWGSAAYYGFHLTYDPPSDFAYAAMGLRDSQPWKHRIRMLALEGQIYERDVGNPAVALTGRFDFAFLAAFIVPLALIMLLYDLRVGERIAGRHDLLESITGEPFSFWMLRAFLRAGALFLCLLIPLVVAGLIIGAAPFKLFLASLYIFFYFLFWTVLCFYVSAWRKPGPVILTILVSTWILTAVLLPASARLAIDRLVPIPSGADILLLQRETVNDAWDLPREVTMNAFFARHPEWSGYEPVDSSFEWQWYYAFQQVGDQKAEQLASAYQAGRLERDKMASWASFLAPPLLLKRALQSLASTDLKSSTRYDEKVRAYHAALRGFY